MSRKKVKAKKYISIMYWIIVLIVVLFQLIGTEVLAKRDEHSIYHGSSNYLEELYQKNLLKKSNNNEGKVSIAEMILDIQNRNETQISDWININSSELLGNSLLNNHKPVDMTNGYCLGEYNQFGSDKDTELKKDDKTTKIVTVMDVNVETRTIIIYSDKYPDGKTYSFDYEEWNETDINANDYKNATKIENSVRPALMLAYLTWKADVNGETDASQKKTTETYKVPMQAIMTKPSLSGLLQNLGFSNYLKPVPGSKYNKEESFTSSYTKYKEAWEWATEQIEAAKNNGNASIKYTFEDRNKKPEYVINDKGIFMGPYQIRVKNCDIGSIIADDNTTINNVYKADYTTTMTIDELNNTAKENDNGDTEKFYIKVNDVNSIGELKVETKNAIDLGMKVRMVFSSSGSNQPFIIYKSESQQGNPKISLTVPQVQYGNLKITKTDELIPEGEQSEYWDLTGIEFKVYSKQDGGWVQYDSNTNEVTSTKSSFEEATPLVIRKIENSEKGYPSYETEQITKLPEGKYLIYETKIPEELQEWYELRAKLNGGKAKGNSVGEVEVKAGASANVTYQNKRSYGRLQIHKVDEDNPEKDIEGIQFKLYKKDSGWVVYDKNNNNTVTSVTEESVSKATPLTTDKKGLTEEIRRLPLGEYEVYETSVGNNKEYTLKNIVKVNGEEAGMLLDTITVKAEKAGLTFETETNKSDDKPEPKTITISGVVWEDVGEGKTWDYFDSKLTGSDYKIDGIVVRLINRKTGETVQRATTKMIDGVHGSYRFTDVAVTDLDNLYVEFTYDGITYQSVNKGSTTDANASKAEEIKKSVVDTSKTQRDMLNDAFKEITGEGQIIEYEAGKIKLSYSKTEPQDTSKEPTVTLKNVCDRDSSQNVENKENKFIEITKQGYFLVNSDTTDSYLKDAYDALVKASKDEVKEIPNVNLGLYKRIQPDVRLDTEITKATVTVNGTTYDYTNDTERNPELNTWPDNGTSFERTNPGLDDSKYKAPKFEATIKYENDINPDKELKVYATYKIALTNNLETSLSTRINAITEKYSKEFAFNRAYMLGGNGEEISIQEDKSSEKEEANCKSITIDGLADIVGAIDAGKTKYIYVVLEIAKDEILHEKHVDESKIYRSWAEISSYTVLKDDKTYAAVDKDSIPNNGTFPARNEDDEGWATGLQLVYKPIGGGDKIPPTGDITIKGTVFEDSAVTDTGAGKERLGNGAYDSTEKVIQNVQVELVSKTDNSVVETATTNNKGQYELHTKAPGKYFIRFTWGEGKDSKTSDGKQITVSDYKSTIWKNTNQNPSDTWFKQESPRLSDALDSWEVRTKLDKENASLQDLLNNPKPSVQGNAVMISETKDIDISSNTEVINNIDFGIIERPIQSIEIEKGVDSVKVISDQDQPIIEAYIKNGQLEVLSGANCVTGGPQLGYIKCEIDTDIINSGTHAEVGYKITVKNTSEIDYDSKEYYYYGSKAGNLVTITADGIYDYLSGISADVDKIKDKWEILNKDSKNVHTKTVTASLATRYAATSSYSSWYEETYEDGVKYIEEKIGDIMKETISEYNSNELLTIKNIQSVFKGGNEISKLASNVTLEPGKSEEIKYDASTIITTTGDIRFDNAVETANVIRNGKIGRNVNVENSNFYDKAEWITITPPTGEDRDYAAIIIVSVAAITLLGVGVVLIKKVVLK